MQPRCPLTSSFSHHSFACLENNNTTIYVMLVAIVAPSWNARTTHKIVNNTTTLLYELSNGLMDPNKSLHRNNKSYLDTPAQVTDVRKKNKHY